MLHVTGRTILAIIGTITAVPAVSGVVYHSAHTDVGIFVGRFDDVSFNDRKYQLVKYLGIPYGEDPSGVLRFRRPRLKSRLTTAYNATYTRTPCLQAGFGQTNLVTSENCLYLNVYAPAESSINPTRKYPVMVYFHGGKFLVGSPNDIAPDVLASVGGVIVVTVSYRLNVFGFLSSGDESAGGNYGLWDQQLAVKWVRYNVASFGGDVHRITLVGQAAGAASVLYQAMYAGNRGLFQRVIAMSGSFLSSWALGKPNAKEFARKLKCWSDDNTGMSANSRMVECLRGKPALDLLKASLMISNEGPVIDGEFIVDHPKAMLFPKNGNTSDSLEFFRSLDVIIGVNNMDGTKTLTELLASEFGTTNFNKVDIKQSEFEHVVIPTLLRPTLVSHELADHSPPVQFETMEHIKQTVLFHYTNWSDPDSELSRRNNVLRLCTDVDFAVPAAMVADAHSAGNNNNNRTTSTHLYEFVHKPSFSVQQPAWVRGAAHGSETLFVFGFPRDMMHGLGLTRTLVSSAETRLSERMMKWLTNFAKSGSPNEPIPLDYVWPSYSADRHYLELSADISAASMKVRFNQPSTAFWRLLVPAFLVEAAAGPHTPRAPAGTSGGAIYFTKFNLTAKVAENLIIALICVSCASMFIVILLCLCHCMRWRT